MTAYGAVTSLRNTINFILHSSHFSIEPFPHLIQLLVYQKLDLLQEILEDLDRTSMSKSRKKVNAVDGRIKDLIWEFQDLLETLLYKQILGIPSQPQILSQSPNQVEDEGMKERVWDFQGLLKSLPSQSRSLEDEDNVGGERIRFSIDLQFLEYHVPSFVDRLEDLEKEYIWEVETMPEDDDEVESKSISTRSGTKFKMIGLLDQFQQLKKTLMESDISKQYTALVGTAGVGKTALAEAVFEDPEIMSRFDHRFWVRVGRKSNDNISRQIDKLSKKVKGKKCLLVLDDVWEVGLFDYLKDCSRFRYPFESFRFLVTTRGRQVIKKILPSTSTILVRFLKEEESKELLCEKVFGEKDCPFQLDKAVTKIAKNCEGLPLMIITVANIISEAQNTDPNYWDDVAAMRNSVFKDAYNEISKVLFPSYDYLPQYLKMPFLYMGVFSRDYDIPRSKLATMLATEGWFHNKCEKLLWEVFFKKCLKDLCDNWNLVLFNEISSFNGLWSVDFIFKSFWLHGAWRHVCRGEAQKRKFYYVLNKLVEGLEDGVKGQRCLCLENNILFSIKDFCNSVRLNCESYTRSLLFFGPYHQYPIPVGNDFKLIWKLDAMNLRLYTFPTEILTLVLLKHLALTCNGELPPTISKLFNLRVLIIHPHSNIRICGSPSYIPIQIWDMQELEHIEILGKNLKAPCHSASLEKLSTLVGVNASISTIVGLSRKFSCIRKLGVQIELTPYDDHSDLVRCFDCISISTLESLKSLKCSIINPVLKDDYAFRSSLMRFPIGLRKLHLSGMGFPWEYMDAIGSLPTLQVLKLRAYAFRGPKWEAQERSFCRLLYLLIEDSDLVQWKPRSNSFPNLVRLRMKHCYKLEEIHWVCCPRVGRMELENCNPAALAFVKQLRPKPCSQIDVIATSSFDEKPITIKFSRFGHESEANRDAHDKRVQILTEEFELLKSASYTLLKRYLDDSDGRPLWRVYGDLSEAERDEHDKKMAEYERFCKRRLLSDVVERESSEMDPNRTRG